MNSVSWELAYSTGKPYRIGMNAQVNLSHFKARLLWVFFTVLTIFGLKGFPLESSFALSGTVWKGRAPKESMGREKFIVLPIKRR